jgi:HlyD family secretion protein
VKRIVVLVLVMLVVGGGVWAYLANQSRGNAPGYRLARVERGPLTATVSASGNLAAVTTVQVGSQLSGQIREIRVDFNSIVERGQVIARLDPEIFEAKVTQARAEVESARASVLTQQAQVERARADVENARAGHAEARAQTAKAQVALLDARRDLDRRDELFRRELIARSERDSAQAAHDSAIAQLDATKAKEAAVAAAIGSAAAQLRVAEAQLTAARAQVTQKQAALEQARVDLDRTTIRAPVDGVVVSRQVDVGQTVAASLQAPTLFTIAQDLTKMQVETSVDEADIGRITLGDRSIFTVDAFPGETFGGSVAQIRKAPQVVQNVVTYTVVVGVDNPGGRLLPGMTANVKVVVAEKPSVLKVPNAALRFRPTGADAGPAATAGAPGAPAGDATAGPRPTVEQIREGLVKSLALTDAQRHKLDAILEDSRQRMTALRGGHFSDADRQAHTRTIRESSRARIREILTPEQQRRYDEQAPAPGGRARGGVPGRVWRLGPDGKPVPVSITLGLTDGTTTEVLRGDLDEGQDVIVGAGAGGPGRATRPGQSPRLRL